MRPVKRRHMTIACCRPGAGPIPSQRAPASQLVKPHAVLDALVLKAYGWSTNDDLLSNLLDLNQELAEQEANGEAIARPWAPV